MSEEKYNRNYFEGGEYESYEGLEDETKSWYLEIISLAGINSGQGKALDVGCAYGYSHEVLESLGYNAFGLDISQYCIKKCKEEFGEKKFAVGDVQEAIPFNGKFDLITCLDTLEHMKRPESALKNMYKKIKEGGFFVASTPNKDWWRRKVGFHSEQETHTSVKTATEWKKILERLEWSELEVKPLQTVPLIWRVLDSSLKFYFPWGEIVYIKGVK